MKNSAWYHKLWRKKVDEFPISPDANTAWSEMQQLLDKHIPVTASGNKKPAKSVGSTIVSMLGFILPAAAMISTITYIAVKHPFKNKPAIKQQQEHLLKKQHRNTFSDSVATTPADSDYLSAAAQSTGLPPAAISKAPDQLAFANVAAQVITRNQYPNGRLMGNAANRQQQSIAYQDNMVIIAAESPSAYNGIECPQPPATLFTIIGPDTARHGFSSELFTRRSINNINLLAMVNQTPNGSSSITSHADRDGITVNSPDNSKAEKSKTRREKKESKIKIKTTKYKTPGNENDTSRLSVGLFSGLNLSGASVNPFAGIALNFHLQDRWVLNTGFRFDINQHINSTYPHASYTPRDSVPFLIRDKRKAQVLSIPVNLEYAISKLISISAGPQISVLLQQKRAVKPSDGPSTYILNVPNLRDTISHGQSIDSALNLTTLSKLNIGLSGGISLHLSRHVNVDVGYQQNITPYIFNNSYLGNSKPHYHSVQVDLRYQFGK